MHDCAVVSCLGQAQAGANDAMNTNAVTKYFITHLIKNYGSSISQSAILKKPTMFQVGHFGLFRSEDTFENRIYVFGVIS
jgi:hypothetical protein